MIDALGGAFWERYDWSLVISSITTSVSTGCSAFGAPICEGWAVRELLLLYMSYINI